MVIRNLIIVVLALCSSQYTFSQGRIQQIDITFSKTTSLVFKYPIVNVDRGSDDVIAQKVKEVENTLQIKAARRNFPETNLTVITADGKLHHFYVNYSDRPDRQTFSLDTASVGIAFTNGGSVMLYKQKVDKILSKGVRGSSKQRKGFRIKFSLNGIYIDGGEIFYDITIRNKSNIRYDIQSMRFFIRDRKKAKRTATQEIELTPGYISSSMNRVDGHGSLRIVYVLNKFTIPDSKSLDIELFEKNGGRNLKLRIKNHTIVKAERLPK
jgi:conjugative transposon TraN protein